MWASLVAQTVKNLPAVQENRVQSLGWEAPLEEGMATHSSVLAWRSQWTGEPGGLQPTGSHSQTRLSTRALTVLCVPVALVDYQIFIPNLLGDV